MTAGRQPSKRPAFDPSRVRPSPEDAALFARQREAGAAVLTVTQLTRLIRGAITKELPGDVHVVGELSNVSAPAGGHLYFTLKDDASEVRCVMWRSSAKDLRFDPADGTGGRRHRFTSTSTSLAGSTSSTCGGWSRAAWGRWSSRFGSSRSGWRRRACSTRGASGRCRSSRSASPW